MISAKGRAGSGGDSTTIWTGGAGAASGSIRTISDRSQTISPPLRR